jgi:hypothetical protein
VLVRAGRDLLSARPPLDLPRLTHPHPHPLLDHADDTTTVARRFARATSSASSNGRAAAGARADPSAGHLDADDDQLSSATAHHLDARAETDWVEVAPANGEAEYWLHSLTGEKVHEPPMEWILAQEAKIDAATATNATRTPRARSTDAEPSRQGVVAAAQKKMKSAAGVGVANAFALLGDDDGDDDDGDGDAPATRARPATRAPPATKVPAAKPDPVAAMDAEAERGRLRGVGGRRGRAARRPEEAVGEEEREVRREEEGEEEGEEARRGARRERAVARRERASPRGVRSDGDRRRGRERVTDERRCRVIDGPPRQCFAHVSIRPRGHST